MSYLKHCDRVRQTKQSRVITMRIRVETGMHEFEATCADDVDLDGVFPCVDEYGDKLNVVGWACRIDIIPEDE